MTKLAVYRDQVDPSGLASTESIESIDCDVCLPLGWYTLKLQKNPLYAHQQWRSPTKRTAVGVAYVHMPLPLSAKTFAWLAMDEAAKRVDDGQLQKRWTDDMGREWFEGQSEKYHLTGYVITKGFDAWISYYGYRVKEPAEAAEIALAQRSMATFLPTPLALKAAADAAEGMSASVGE